MLFGQGYPEKGHLTDHRTYHALLTEGIMTYCLTKNLSDVNILHMLLTNGIMANTLLQSKVGFMTYYLKLYPGEVIHLTRPSIQMRLCCITSSVSRHRPQGILNHKSGHST
ncbi:testis-specific basic protein Y 2-like [Hylobates moloch]|uniref:testis-specific basic protein Y 2-like n=1 Tax=Hylobates moloch TaxID=81572 RepID=UPI0026744417|nr:testis-specific basic protein Y 2-like [Hylobates moloch]